MGAHKPEPMLLGGLRPAETRLRGRKKATRKELSLVSAELAHSAGSDAERLRHICAPEAVRARAIKSPVEERAYTAAHFTPI